MFLHIEFADGQERDIPVDNGKVLHVYETDLGIVDSVAFDGVTVLALDLGSLPEPAHTGLEPLHSVGENVGSEPGQPEDPSAAPPAQEAPAEPVSEPVDLGADVTTAPAVEADAEPASEPETPDAA